MVIHAFFRLATNSGIVFHPLIHTAGEDNGTSIGVNDFLNIGGSVSCQFHSLALPGNSFTSLKVPNPSASMETHLR